MSKTGYVICYEGGERVRVPKEDIARPCGVGMIRVSDTLMLPTTVDIVCPRCGKKHTHGFAPGYRAPHCNTHGVKKDYFIDLREKALKGLSIRIDPGVNPLTMRSALQELKSSRWTKEKST